MLDDLTLHFSQVQGVDNGNRYMSVMHFVSFSFLYLFTYQELLFIYLFIYFLYYIFLVYVAVTLL